MLQIISKPIKIILLTFLLTLFSIATFSQNITYKNDLLGNIIAVDNMGNTIATYKKDLLGNTVVYDARGRLIGTYKKDLLGNTVFESESNSANTTLPNYVPKFNPYVQQNPLLSLTPEERATYYENRNRKDQATAEAIAGALGALFSVSPEQKARMEEARQEKAELRERELAIKKAKNEQKKDYFNAKVSRKTDKKLVRVIKKTQKQVKKIEQENKKSQKRIDSF
jgi:hypothetical protein